MKLLLVVVPLLGGCELYFGDEATDPASPDSRRLVAGGRFTCLLADEAIKCWGANHTGQVGLVLDREYLPQPATPTPTLSSATGTQITAGGEHACAIDDGVVSCWGSNAVGQLGRETTPYSDPNHHYDYPGTVSLPRSAIRLAAGRGHTCAVLDDASLWCWGDNTHGQLGTESGSTYRPARVLDDVKSVATGYGHTCAVISDASVWCWGENSHGQLGDGNTTSRAVPRAVEGVLASQVVAGRSHTCVVDTNSGVACWGANDEGQLGDGTATPHLTPGIPIVADAVQLAARADHTCAVSRDGTLACWGANTTGQLGAGDAVPHLSPVIPSVGGTIREVAVGDAHTCVRRNNGTVACWGKNSVGELGDGGLDIDNPQQVHLASGSSTLAVGDHHACAVVGSSKSVYCRGDNRYGQLGDDANVARATPVEIGLTGVTELTAGRGHTCARGDDLTLRCWGLNRNGQLGDGTFDSRAAPVLSQLGGVTTVDAGGDFTCATTASGTYCFGANNARQLVAPGPSSATPVMITDSEFATLAAGSSHACGIAPDGTLTCWGSNTHGQIGNGGIGPSSPPEGPSGTFITVAAGFEHTCAAQTDGVSVCWGRGDMGALGAPYVDSSAPQRPGVSHVVLLAAGLGFSCAGARWDIEGVTQPFFQCWGRNHDGESGATGQSRIWYPMIGIGTLRASSLADAGAGFACALNGGAVSCWGDNSFGQLGTGTFSRSLAPVEVTL